MNQAQTDTAITAAIDNNSLTALKAYHTAANLPGGDPHHGSVDNVAKRLA